MIIEHRAGSSAQRHRPQTLRHEGIPPSQWEPSSVSHGLGASLQPHPLPTASAERGAVRGTSRREHGDAGGYAATGISSTSRSMSGYQRLKMALSSPFSVRTRVCNNKCAPSLDHCMCCFLQKRLLTTSFTVDSTNPVAIGSTLRYRSHDLEGYPRNLGCPKSVVL